MKSFRSLGSALFLTSGLGILAFSVPANAQTSVSVPTLTSLSNFEQSLTSSTVLPPLTNLPPSVLASIAGGALDLRMQTNYNPQGNLLTLTFFTVQTGSPSPTNLGTVNPASIFGGATIGVDRTYVTSKAVMFVGTVASGSNTLVGSIQGLPASFSFAYSTDTPPKITNAMTLVAGTIVLFSPTATGTVNITQPTGGSGTGGTSGVTIVVSASGGNMPVGTNSFQVTTNQIVLDASKSTSTNAGPLTYSWALAPNSANANIIQGNTATPLIQLSVKQQTYQFIVTVTDSTGATATATITVQYV
jgi:hypothetical protein